MRTEPMAGRMLRSTLRRCSRMVLGERLGSMSASQRVSRSRTLPAWFVACLRSTSATSLLSALAACRREPVKFRDRYEGRLRPSRPVYTRSFHLPLPGPPHSVSEPLISSSTEYMSKVMSKRCYGFMT